ncbi:MAG TPA: thioredoxin fold domain-containing protein, partial [Burkholderiaceae bacterium]
MKALHLTALATLLALSALSAPSAQAASTAPASQGVAWHEAAGDADIESAFAKARAEKKPVLLYWGAKWCPPCNQLKATLFNRQDFIEQSKSFVAVHIDGDLPGAQKLGSRFKVRGYPTMILFSNDGNELTRLPGEAEVAQVMRVLQLGLAGGRPIKTVLADGRAGKKLSANEWKLLAFYSWETDEQSLVPKAETPALLAALARAAQGVDEDSSTRLWLKALATSDDGKGIAPDAALRARVQAVLAKPAAARQQMDVLAYYGTDIVSVLAPKPGPERDGLIADFSLALKRLEADATLSRSDRLAALTARIELARLNQS